MDTGVGVKPLRCWAPPSGFAGFSPCGCSPRLQSSTYSFPRWVLHAAGCFTVPGSQWQPYSHGCTRHCPGRYSVVALYLQSFLFGLPGFSIQTLNSRWWSPQPRSSCILHACRISTTWTLQRLIACTLWSSGVNHIWAHLSYSVMPRFTA